MITQILAAAPPLPGWRVRAILDSDSLDGRRSETLFPSDENGDVLFGIAEGAGDLITSRPVDYCHIFPSSDSAAQFTALLPKGECSEPERYRGRKGLPWQVVVTREMIPSHNNITTTEAQLADVASKLGGIPDGWGFMSS
ncbi:ribonuclease E inhibitor RraB [Phragmitibacter flavus]|uniref:ribonuclease E inhibitor RraB n=1 Tax=Phragmitibacter flavus TaxID=2576071 RepID=UPI001981E31F|nr:ribonuclease E inhibitor RraB [Phragmitibacter flavus]